MDIRPHETPVHKLTHGQLRRVLGMRLRHARGRAGLTQKEAARSFPFSASTLSRIEWGERVCVDLFELQDLAAFYGLDFDELRSTPTPEDIIRAEREYQKHVRRKD